MLRKKRASPLISNVMCEKGNQMEVLPGIGTDVISFGANEQEAINLLGNPDKVYTTDGDCKRLQFNKLQIELSFELDNNNLLGWLEVHEPNAVLFGRKLIGIEQNEVLNFVTARLNEEPEIEDYGSFISVTYETHWIELQFEFGVLKSINLGVMYNDSDDPQWPNT